MIPQQPQQTHQQFSQKQNQAQPSKNTQQKNHTNTQGYQTESIRNEIQNLITLLLTAARNNKKSIYKLYTNTKHSISTMKMSPNLMGGSSISTNEPLMVFTGTDP